MTAKIKPSDVHIDMPRFMEKYGEVYERITNKLVSNNIVPDYKTDLFGQPWFKGDLLTSEEKNFMKSSWIQTGEDVDELVKQGLITIRKPN